MIRWGVGYAIFPPENPICGFILNPDAEKIYEIRFCNEPAVYGFRFSDNDPQDIGTALNAWQGVCAEHATDIRDRNLVAEMWSLKTEGNRHDRPARL